MPPLLLFKLAYNDLHQLTTLGWVMTAKVEVRGAKVEVKCKGCRTVFLARVADRKRGWGKYCSKSCKAKVQEGRTGQYARWLAGESQRAKNDHDNDLDYEGQSWDAHKNSF